VTSDPAERLRLGIDLDGVVADFNRGWMARYNRDFGATLQASDVVQWDGLHRLTHFESMDDFWSWAQLGSASIFRDLPAFEGAIETMTDLARDHRIVIISSKFDWAVADTLAWMSEHRVPAREIHFVWDKTTVPCDVYLEDAPHNLAALVQGHPGALVCRMVRPWNRPLDGAVDVASWAEFAQHVRAWEQDHRPVEDAGLPRS
jgi:5'(3')-deoxyribonucleotidase